MRQAKSEGALRRPRFGGGQEKLVGRQFDAAGNLKDWWTKDDELKFTERADCMVKQDDAIESVPGVHLNGKLTLGENLADLGGLWLAWLAWLSPAARESSNTGKRRDSKRSVASRTAVSSLSERAVGATRFACVSRDAWRRAPRCSAS